MILLYKLDILSKNLKMFYFGHSPVGNNTQKFTDSMARKC